MILLQCDGMSSWIKGCDVCIPGKIGSLVSTIYTAILIAVPLILILSGMFTMATSVMKQSEDEIKKAQKLLVKKLVTGAIIFLLFALVRWLVSYFDNSLTTCFDSLINYNKTTDVCEVKYDTNGKIESITGGPGCAGMSQNDFWDINNKCKTHGADGAVKLYTGEIICYVKDFENCSCSAGVPYKRVDKESGITEQGCKCAVQSGSVYLEQNGTSK